MELCYLGETGGTEETLAREAGIPFLPVETGQIRGRAPWVVARNLVRMLRGTRQCSRAMRQFRPDVVFVTGGYVAAPVAWAARRARGRSGRTPLLIYLPDITPGQAIRLTSRLASKVAVSFPEVAHYFGAKAVVTGYPVRPELMATNRRSARQALGLAGGQGEAELPVLLVFGGSRGARTINRAAIAALPGLLPRCQIVHISGQTDWPAVSNAAEALSPELRAHYHPYAYLKEEMLQALAAADLVVARAGASTLGEFPAVGLPSILVPYPFAGQHQDVNARYLADRGAAVVLADRELPERLMPLVLELLASPERLAAMSRAAQALARPDAAQNIARELLQLAGC